VSGIDECDEAGEEKLAGALAVATEKLGGAVDPALVGFLHVALARDLHLAAAASHDVEKAKASDGQRLLETYRGIQTKFDAAKYIHDVDQKYRAFRGGA
jgi:hypothetical protein